MAILALTPAFGQPIVNPPAFEVAAVKPNTSSENIKQVKGRFLQGGRIDLPNRTLKFFIMSAFDVPADMVTGGPKWLDSDRFDLAAKAPAGADENTLRTMLQTLLAERFKLVTHREDKIIPEYALVVGKGGPKLTASPQPGPKNCSWERGEADASPASRSDASSRAGRSLRRRICHNMTMAQLAKDLPGWGGIGIDRRVVDLTGLPGEYDFRFEVDPPKKPGSAADDSGPTIFDAMARLGLKLESRKLSTSVIVVDHVERVPTEN